MNVQIRKPLAIGLVAAFVGGGVALAQGKQGVDWVRTDLTVDMERAPACIGMAGSDGKPMVRADGSPVLVPFEPPVPDVLEQLARATSHAERQRIELANAAELTEIHQRATDPQKYRDYLLELGDEIC